MDAHTIVSLVIGVVSIVVSVVLVMLTHSWWSGDSSGSVREKLESIKTQVGAIKNDMDKLERIVDRRIDDTLGGLKDSIASIGIQLEKLSVSVFKEIQSLRDRPVAHYCLKDAIIAELKTRIDARDSEMAELKSEVRRVQDLVSNFLKELK